MTYLKQVIRKWFGEGFPRRVTAPGGGARWLDHVGKSFGTVEEACHD
jgi:hypothetical protein